MIDPRHHAAVVTVLEAVRPLSETRYPHDPARALAYAQVVLEDALVAVHLALDCAVSLPCATDLVRDAGAP